MIRRTVVALFAITTVLSALAVISAPATADHAYSHRYVVVGRVIDSLGQPALGWTATATLSGPGTENPGPCQLPPTGGVAAMTDGSGDFFLCFHVHGLSGGTVTVSGPDYTHPSELLDLNLRKTFVTVRLLTEWQNKDPAAVAAFHRNYLVLGRVWQPQPGANIEGIPVNGVAFANEPLSVQIGYNSGKEHAAQDRTNGYGDYRHPIPLEETLSTGTLAVTSHGQRVTRSVDSEFMVSDLDVFVPPPPNPLLEFLMNYYWAIVAPAAVVVASWYVLPRLRPRRHAHDVSRLPGIGRAKARILREAGVRTIDKLAASSPKELAEATHVPLKEAKRLVRKAKEFLDAEREQSLADDDDET